MRKGLTCIAFQMSPPRGVYAYAKTTKIIALDIQFFYEVGILADKGKPTLGLPAHQIVH